MEKFHLNLQTQVSISWATSASVLFILASEIESNTLSSLKGLLLFLVSINLVSKESWIKIK